MAEPTGVIRPQPRNAALGALADFLQRANTAAARVQFNPQIAPQFTLADLLPLEGAAGLMQDVAAYGPRALIKGGNVATGGIGTFRPDPRILDVAEAAAIGAPVARAAARPVGRMAAQQIERAMSEGRGPLGAALGPVRPLPLDVYHGTPHRFPAEEGAPFGRFKAEKIGTGEGAQAYGHGHYTAEARGVGEDYRKKLSKVGPQRIEETLKVPMDQAGALWAAARVASGDLQTNMSPEKILEAYSASLRKLPEEQRNELLARAIQEYQTPPGTLYKIDLPDEAIDKMLDWDKPLSEQPEAVRKAIADAQSIGMFKNIDDRATGAQIYNASIGESGGGQRGEEASRMLREMGIPGIKYLDQVSRNKPLKDIRREFLNELPEDAGLDEVVSLLGTGTFSPKNEAIIKALAENDWLGFDYPSQALSTALSPSLNNYDFSSSLMRAVNSAQEGGTRNFVVFPGNEDLLRIIERNNEKLPESSPGYAEGGPVIKEPSLFNLTDYAAFQAARMFPKDRGQDDRRDAARHMLAAGMLARRFEPETVERMGRWYEYKESPGKAIGTLFGGSMPPDYDMDTHNNQVGIMLGQQAKDQADLERLVRKYAREAALNEKNEGQAMIRVLKHPPLPPQQRQLYAGGGIVRSEFEYDPAAVDARAAALMEEIDAA